MCHGAIHKVIKNAVMSKLKKKTLSSLAHIFKEKKK